MGGTGKAEMGKGSPNRTGGRGRAGRAKSGSRGPLRLLLLWVFCLWLLWPAQAGAEVSVVNGDFANGLTGWTIASPGVFTENGAAVMVEGQSNPAFLGQTFTVKAGTPTLYFTLLSLTLADNNEAGNPPDAFQVSLVNSVSGSSLVGAIPGGSYPGLLLSVQQDGKIHYAPQVAIAGAPASGGVWTSRPETIAVTVDLSGITADTSATLVFALVNFGADRTSTVRIDNVQTVAFPVAGNDSAMTPEDTAVQIDVLANDSDPDGTPVPATVAVATAPAHGTAAPQADGRILYTPALNYHGPDSFTYTVRDADGNLSNAAAVNLTVTDVNDPPVANAGRDQSVTAGNLVTLDGSASADPEGSAPTYLWAQEGPPDVTLSSATAQKPTFTAPAAGPAGAQLTFRLTVSDGQLSASDTVTVSVAQAGFTPPTAADDSASTPEDTPVEIGLLANDAAAAGTTLNPATVQVVVPPIHGTLVHNTQTGAATYTPAANYAGSDAFTYKVTDFKGLVSNEAAVILTVTAVNDDPAANAGPDQSVTGGTTVTLSGAASSDTEGAIATYLWEQIGDSTVTLSNPNGVQTTFTAPGVGLEGATLTFRLTVTDGGGRQMSDTVAVHVVTQGVIPPVANPDSATTAEDTPVVVDLLQNDTNSAGGLEAATVAVVTPPVHGSVTLNAQTGAATYTPAADYFGTDSFSYQVRDNGDVLSNVAAVALTVTAVNDPPIAVAGPEQSVREGVLVTLDGSASRDAEDAAPLFAWTQTGGTPAVTLSSPGAAKPTFTAPSVGPAGTILTFRLTLTDSGSLQGTDTVIVRIGDAVLPCDVNDDKAVNMADAVLLLKAVAGISLPGPLALTADVNGDGLLGMPEAFCALQTAAGLRFDPGRDADGDGFTPIQGDCNDGSAAIHPGAAETCNGIDDNCNGQIDEGLPQIAFFRDADGDRYGDPNSPVQSCSRPAGYVTNNTDCNDSDPILNPGQIWYKDADNDGFSDGTTAASCTRPAGYRAAVELLATSGDCNDSDANVHSARTWFRDADGDGFGDPAVTTAACSQPAGYVANKTDCNDANAAVHPGATELCNGVDDNCNGQIDDGASTAWYRDADGDGYGSATVTTTACAQPAGYVADSTDCDDGSATLHPGQTWYKDADNDGYSDGTMQTSCTRPTGYKISGELTAASGDCNDGSAAVHPGATETCNGIDDNCNAQTDEGLQLTTYYRDADGDGYGVLGVTTQACTQPAGYVVNSTDCNDGSAAIHPGATEVCNGVDDDCDAQIDEGVKTTFYRDADGDGYGALGVTTQACALPAGYVANSTDCNDGSATVHLTMTGYADADGDTYTLGGVQTLCTNGTLPTGYVATQKAEDCDDTNGNLHPGQTWYKDTDNDGYSEGTTQTSCTRPAGYKLASELTAASGDCNDGNAAVHPGATEVCNGVDDDCDTQTDEGVTATFYRDADSDGYGASGNTTQACSAPAGYVASSTDCNDSAASIHPTATDVCGDGIDQDCSGTDLACTYSHNGFTPVGGETAFYVAAQDVRVYKATTSAGYPLDGMMIEIYGQRLPGGVYPGTFTIPYDTSPATSHTVVIIDYQCGAMPGSCQKSFLAVGGTVNISAYGSVVGQTFAGTLTNVILKEAVIAPDRTAALVPGGEVWFLPSYSFNQALQEQTPAGPPVVSGIQLFSYGWPPAGGFDGFDFSAGSMVSNPDPVTPDPLTDFYIEHNLIILGSNVGILSLGNTANLADVAAVPSVGYVAPLFGPAPVQPFIGDPPYDATGYVYALKLADGTYAAIQITEHAYDLDGEGDGYTLRTTFSYKYPMTAIPPGPSNVTTGTRSLANRDTYDNDAFIFSTQQVVADDGSIPWDGPADIAVKGSSLYMAAGGIQSLGEGTTLDATTSVPASGYTPSGHASWGILINTGQVYALQLGDGKYAAIEFTEINTDVGSGVTRCTFHYKYQTNGTPSLQ